MKIRYFYNKTSKHAQYIPSQLLEKLNSDWVELTEEEYAIFLKPLCNQEIVTGPDGKPMIVDLPGPSDEEEAARIRWLRDARLQECDWVTGYDVKLSPEKKLQWETYRQALRDITSQSGFPRNVVFPESP